MSNTIVAGAKIRAANVPWQRMWSVSSTTATGASAITTSETVVLTAPSTTYKAGGAYMLEARALGKINTAAGGFGFSVRDTNAAGTVRKTISYIWAGNTANNFETHWFHPVINSGGSDITARVLVLTSAVTANTGQVNAGTAIPYYFTCYYVGLASDYPEAVAL